MQLLNCLIKEAGAYIRGVQRSKEQIYKVVFGLKWITDDLSLQFEERKNKSEETLRECCLKS